MTYYIASDGVHVDVEAPTFSDLYRAMGYAATECSGFPWSIYTHPTDGASVATFDEE
jgi:hypothetical protein